MKCPEGLHWIPDREYCSKCPPGQVFNALWGECQKMDRSVINPGQYHTASAALFGWDKSNLSKDLVNTVKLVVGAGTGTIAAAQLVKFLEDERVLRKIEKEYVGFPGIMKLMMQPSTIIMVAGGLAGIAGITALTS